MSRLTTQFHFKIKGLNMDCGYRPPKWDPAIMGTRHEQLVLAAKKEHAERPQVWDLFCKYTFQLIRRGFKHYSANLGTFSIIRWHEDVPGSDGESTFKLNNNLSPYYARAFMRAYPEYAGFYRTRELTSRTQDAVAGPELTPEDFPTWPKPPRQIAP